MMSNVQDCEPNYHLKICLKTIIFGRCTASKKQHDSCRFYMNADKNYMKCKYE